MKGGTANKRRQVLSSTFCLSLVYRYEREFGNFNLTILQYSWPDLSKIYRYLKFTAVSNLRLSQQVLALRMARFAP
jgi:hypothetical protein